jgi:hypothetical protein
VWDRDEQTAVQSLHGGTKIAWGGTSVAAKLARNRQRFDLATAEPPAEADRLVTLGAVELDAMDGTIELADPDGNEFTISVE